MPKLHSKRVHKYPWIYCLNIWLFEFRYKFKSTNKFPFNDMCLYQTMGFDVEKCVFAMVGDDYSMG
jgi:hypothetical protein